MVLVIIRGQGALLSAAEKAQGESGSTIFLYLCFDEFSWVCWMFVQMANQLLCVGVVVVVMGDLMRYDKRDKGSNMMSFPAIHPPIPHSFTHSIAGFFVPCRLVECLYGILQT